MSDENLPALAGRVGRLEQQVNTLGDNVSELKAAKAATDANYQHILSRLEKIETHVARASNALNRWLIMIVIALIAVLSKGCFPFWRCNPQGYPDDQLRHIYHPLWLQYSSYR